MKFSIIVPVYKAESFLKKCLDSIAVQTFSDFEVILVDDGSPDNCPQICDSYSANDKRFRVIHQKNSGAFSARLSALKIAVGDYICCVDADDRISKDYLALFSCAIDSFSPDLVCCGYKFVTRDGNTDIRMNSRDGYYSKEDIRKEVYPNLVQSENGSYFLPVLWAKAIKRELFKKYYSSVPSLLTMGEDRSTIVPLVYEASSLVVIPECSYFYTYNSTSITNGLSYDWNQINITENYLSSVVDLNSFDFKNQMNRFVVHGLFTCIYTFMTKNSNYFAVVKEVGKVLELPEYSRAIESCFFSGSKKASFMVLCLRKRLLYPVWLYSRFVLVKNRMLALH